MSRRNTREYSQTIQSADDDETVSRRTTMRLLYCCDSVNKSRLEVHLRTTDSARSNINKTRSLLSPSQQEQTTTFLFFSVFSFEKKINQSEQRSCVLEGLRICQRGGMKNFQDPFSVINTLPQTRTYTHTHSQTFFFFYFFFCFVYRFCHLLSFCVFFPWQAVK